MFFPKTFLLSWESLNFFVSIVATWRAKKMLTLSFNSQFTRKKNPSEIKRKALFILRAKHLNSLMSKKYLSISIVNV